jgi:hypothetical protein
MALGQMERDRVGASVQPLVSEGLTQLHDLLLELLGGAPGAGMGPPRPRLQARLTLGVEPLDQLLHPPPRHPVVAGDLAVGTPLHPDRRHHQPRQRHRAHLRIEVCTMSPDTCALCPETRLCRAHHQGSDQRKRWSVSHSGPVRTAA